jgi:hypothetical protein
VRYCGLRAIIPWSIAVVRRLVTGSGPWPRLL